MPTTIESGEQFAARFWGGPDVSPVKSEAVLGPRDIDGGRPRFPAGWTFRADGFRYHVWADAHSWHMQASDGSYSDFVRDGDEWVISAYGNTRRVPAL